MIIHILHSHLLFQYEIASTILSSIMGDFAVAALINNKLKNFINVWYLEDGCANFTEEKLSEVIHRYYSSSIDDVDHQVGGTASPSPGALAGSHSFASAETSTLVRAPINSMYFPSF